MAERFGKVYVESDFAEIITVELNCSMIRVVFCKWEKQKEEKPARRMASVIYIYCLRGFLKECFQTMLPFQGSTVSFRQVARTFADISNQLPPKSGNFQFHVEFQQSFIYSVHANIRLLEHRRFFQSFRPKGIA